MTTWRKHPIEYIDEANDTIYLSIVFTWHLRSARARATWRQGQGYQVFAGGPAVQAMPGYLPYDMTPLAPNPKSGFTPLTFHNPDATYTSRGCPNACPFCGVPRIEGKLQELDNWQPAPVVCDNNLLATSRQHFDNVIDRLNPIRPVDILRGLDTRLLTPYHARRLAELRMPKLRFSWDHTNQEPIMRRAYNHLLTAGFKPRAITILTLINYNDTPEEALYRLQTIADLPARPYPLRYQPLDALEKNSHVAPGWTEEELRRFSQYWIRYYHYRKTPFSLFRIDRAKPLTRPNDLVRFHTIYGKARNAA